MKKSILKTINVPAEISFSAEGNKVKMESKGKKTEKVFVLSNIKMTKEGQQIKLSSENASKRESKLIGSAVAHIKNMVAGLENDFEYSLEICNVHFPMTVKVEGQKLVIKNFLGETIDRIAEILPGVKVDVKGSTIKVSSNDRDSAGQTAANIEKATKIKNRDRRIFQDGIFITQKA